MKHESKSFECKWGYRSDDSLQQFDALPFLFLQLLDAQQQHGFDHELKGIDGIGTVGRATAEIISAHASLIAQRSGVQLEVTAVCWTGGVGVLFLLDQDRLASNFVNLCTSVITRIAHVCSVLILEQRWGRMIG